MSDFNPNPHPPAGAVSNDPARAPMPAPAPDPARVFDEAYVKELRDEAAHYRTQAKPFKDAFDGYEDAELEEWLDLAKTLRADPMAGAERFEEIARQIKQANGLMVEPVQHKTPEQIRAEAQAASNQPAPVVPPAGEDRPMTVREFNALQAEAARRDAAAQAQAQDDARVADVYSEAAKLGYKSGTKEIVDLFWMAQNETGGDLQAAHMALQGADQEVIRRYLQRVSGDSQMPVPMRGGAAPSNQDEPKDFGTARRSLEARLAQL